MSANDEIAKAIAVDVTSAGGTRSKLCRRLITFGVPIHGLGGPCWTAQVNEDAALVCLAVVELHRAHDDVAVAVAIDVTGRSDSSPQFRIVLAAIGGPHRLII